jgi:hypothetical protein
MLRRFRKDQDQEEEHEKARAAFSRPGLLNYYPANAV